MIGVLALAWLLFVQILLSTSLSGPRRPLQLAGLDVAAELVVCGHAADGSNENSPAPAGPHCMLCVLAQTLEAAGPAPADATELAQPRPLPRLWSRGLVAEIGPEPEAGWASSWSSRAPPFHA